MNGVQIEYGQYVYILKFKYSTNWHGKASIETTVVNGYMHVKQPPVAREMVWCSCIMKMMFPGDVFLIGSWIQRILGCRYTFKKKTTWNRNAEN